MRHQTCSPIAHFDTDDGILSGAAIIRHPSVLPYMNPDGTVRYELVPRALLRHRDSTTGKFASSVIAGIPSSYEHPERLFKGDQARIDARQIGAAGNKVEIYKDGDTEVTFHVDSRMHRDSKTVIDGIRSGEISGVSLGYDCETIPEPGFWMGHHYDAYQWLPFEADHFAHTPMPRAGRAKVTRMDSGLHVVEHLDAGIIEPRWTTRRRQRLRYGEFDGAFAGSDFSYPIASRADCAKYWAIAESDSHCDSIRQNIVTIARKFGWLDSLPEESAQLWADRTQTRIDDRRIIGMTGTTPERTDARDFTIVVNKNPHHVDSLLYSDIMAEREGHADSGTLDSETQDKMDTLESDLNFERARADSFEIEIAAIKKDGGKMDSAEHQDAIAAECKSRLDAWMEVRKFLPSKAKFDSSLNAIGQYKLAIAAADPKFKMDELSEDFIRGKFSSMAPPSRTDGTRTDMDMDKKKDMGDDPDEDHTDSSSVLSGDLDTSVRTDEMQYNHRRNASGKPTKKKLTYSRS